MTDTLKRRDFIKQAAVALGLPGLTRAVASPRDNVRPNLLFIFADDQAFDNIGALGCREVHTPNLDRLVRRGVSFSNCYNQGGWHGAICIASRTMLVTGAFLWRAEMLDKRMPEEAEAGRVWPQYLEQAGYRTYMSGKWHVNCDASSVFQTVRHVRPGMPPDVPEQYDRPRDGVPDPFDPSDPALGGFWTGGAHWSEVLGDDGVDFLHDAAKHEAPFFMYLAFNAPHDPRQSPQEYVDKYPLEHIRTPENFQPVYPHKQAIGCGPDLRDERLAPFPRTEHAVRTQRREYYAIISHMDTQVGRILDALDATGRADNTYIFFTADHGLAVGRHGLMGKQNMYEHSMKAPLIVAGPGMPENQRNDALVYLQDIMPTTLALANIPVPEHVAYKSLLPLINGERTQTHEAVYGAYMDKQRMARAGDFKLIYYPGIGLYQLFNLATDPHESKNLADEPRHASQLATLKQRLRALQQENRDPLFEAGMP